METMDFSAFMNVLFNYRKPKPDGKMPVRAEFIEIITDALIPEKAIEDGDISGNPVRGYQDRMLQYIFKGERHIDPEVAVPIRGVMDLPTFESYFDGFSYDALVGLSSDINRYGFHTTPNNVVHACASIMAQLIEHIADGKAEAVTEIDYEAREGGKRHISDIVPASIEYRDGHFNINGEVITVDMRDRDEEMVNTTLRYVEALYEAYESKLKRKIDASNVDTMPQRLQENYKEQNRAFFYADSIRHTIDELYYEGEEEFRKLKADEKTFINSTYWKPYPDGFERLDAVLNRAMEANLSSSVLANIRNLINNLAKEGICQILVNDGDIEFWVIEDE